MNNYSLLSDFYEYTMANGYHLSDLGNRILYFDLFFRRVPDDGGFVIACGLQQVIEHIQNLHFDNEDISFLRNKGIFSEKFLVSLVNFRFSGDIWAVPEGTVVFPGEPLVTVRAKATEAQIIETLLLVCINHQSLIATKANRIVRAARGRSVLEFGARRAHGAESALFGSRAAYIAGCDATSNTMAEKLFGIPAGGTMAHSWVQIFDDEYTAFLNYCNIYPQNPSLLVDTFDTLRNGVPNAIRAFLQTGIREGSIRIDSGDITYLSKRIRKILDEAGLNNIKIIASNSLDENIIREIIAQGGMVDIFGVGERLITAMSDPVLGGVYKLVAVEDSSGNVIPKIKVSENISKITTPHFKKVYRLYSKENMKAEADLICVHNETVDGTKSLEIFDPDFIWKRKMMSNFIAKELMIPIFKSGELVYNIPEINITREKCKNEVESLWDEVKRFENPHNYYVDLSQKLWDEKQRLLLSSR